MQISNMYSVFDRKAGYYLPIFQTRSDAQAVRIFTETVVSQETGDLSKYPADFDLVCLGSMDLDTGELFPEKNSRHILNGLSALQASQAERARYKSALAPSVEQPATDA